MLSARTTAPAPEGAFLRVPAEIRHNVYQALFPNQLHVYTQGDRILISACLETDQNVVRDSQPFNAFLENSLLRHEIEFHPDLVSTATWSRRLGSTWGTHWKCEENASGINSNTQLDGALLLVCWKIRSEVLNLLARTCVIHVTDLEAIGWIERENRMTTLSKPLRAGSALLLGVTHLNITLRLPLALYQSLERLEDIPSQHPELAHPIDNWLRLGSTLSQLPNLSQLWIWLEHDKPCSWSVVHERATLSPLARLSNSPSVDIHVSLPKLHLGLKSQDRHYVNEDHTFFHLHRRIRQRYHSTKSEQGRDDLKFQADFPFLLHFIEFLDLSVAEIERKEHSWWKRGIDIESELKKLHDWF